MKPKQIIEHQIEFAKTLPDNVTIELRIDDVEDKELKALADWHSVRVHEPSEDMPYHWCGLIRRKGIEIRINGI
jgi:hypothetical protein